MRYSVEQIPLGDRRLRLFVKVPWQIHYGDPNWTPPLRADLLGSRILRITGRLTPEHPYHQNAEVTHFLARSGKQLLGRVSAAINHRFNEYHDSSIGFFGFFETTNNFTITRALLDHARDWLGARKIDVMRGPGGYSTATHESNQGILIEGFNTPATIELTHNPSYYSEFLERYGFVKVKDYHAYWIELKNKPQEDLERLAHAVLARRDIKIRQLNLSCLREEVDHIVEIYNKAWVNNWGFLPLTDTEAEVIATSLRMVADPGLIRFAYVSGELAAVLGAIPDPNVCLRPYWKRSLDTDVARVCRLMLGRRRIDRTRLMFFGICPRFRKLGIDAVLYHEVLSYALNRGYRTCEPSMLLEDNDLILRACESMGGRRYKTWRIYEMPL